MNNLETPFLKWVKKTTMSTQLRNSLLLYNSIYPVLGTHTIKKDLFLEVKGVGVKRWEEYERIKNRRNTKSVKPD